MGVMPREPRYWPISSTNAACRSSMADDRAVSNFQSILKLRYGSPLDRPSWREAGHRPSSREGRRVGARARVHAIAAARTPNRAARIATSASSVARVAPSAGRDTRAAAPPNVSPAPTVSTTSTGGTSTLVTAPSADDADRAGAVGHEDRPSDPERGEPRAPRRAGSAPGREEREVLEADLDDVGARRGPASSRVAVRRGVADRSTAGSSGRRRRSTSAGQRGDERRRASTAIGSRTSPSVPTWSARVPVGSAPAMRPGQQARGRTCPSV